MLLLYVLSFVWGACWGSFGSTLIYRSVHKISIFSPVFSFCTSCGVRIRWFQNIPIISYLVLRGRCSNCGEKISLMYLISELLSGTLGVFCALFSDSVYDFLSFFFFMWGLLIAAVSDAMFLSIPTLSVVFSFVGALAKMFVYGEITNGLLGAGFGAGVMLASKVLYRLVKKREGLGEGDVLIMIPSGIYLGLFGTTITLLISSFLGGVLGILLVMVTKRREIPFVPFIFVSVIITIVLEKTFSDFFSSFRVNI